MDQIIIKSLSKRYRSRKNELPIIENANLSIQKGEFVVILGPSGSGKTTLLNLICGIDLPTEGSILIDDVDITKLSPNEISRWRADNIGVIFQSYNLMPYMSAIDNVALPMVFRGLTKSYRITKAAALLRSVGLKERYNLDSNLLSGGEQQRVAIARALVSNPKILIADEPTADLDIANATEIMDILLTLHQEKRATIIMSTHNANYAKYASKVIYIQKHEVSFQKGIA